MTTDVIQIQSEGQSTHVVNQTETITISIPTAIQRTLKRTPQELGRDIRLYAALMLFQLSKLSSGAAAEMAGVPRVMFLDLCADYDIPISQITIEDLIAEVADDQPTSRM